MTTTWGTQLDLSGRYPYNYYYDNLQVAPLLGADYPEFSFVIVRVALVSNFYILKATIFDPSGQEIKHLT